MGKERRVAQRRAVGALLQIHQGLKTGDGHRHHIRERQRTQGELPEGLRLPAGINGQQRQHDTKGRGVFGGGDKIGPGGGQQQQQRREHGQSPQGVGVHGGLGRPALCLYTGVEQIQAQALCQ